jgi:predicted dehydrogenase
VAKNRPSPLGFAIVGTGLISRFHARALAEVPAARLVACCSSRPESAREFADEFSCQAYDTLPELLADPAIHAVSICTPSGAHLEPGVAAARAGKHVIVEKPLEITLRRCDRLIRECELHGVQLATIFPSRFHRASQDLKQAVDSGRFGQLTLGEAYVKWFRTQAYYDSGAWRGTWELDGGGALMNQAIHCVDLLRWLMGPVLDVQARTATLAHQRIAVEDTAAALLRFANGALGVIEASTASFPGALKRIEIHGAAGSAVLEEEDLIEWRFAQPQRSDAAIRRRLARRTSTAGGASDPRAIGHAAHARQFADFVQAIAERRPPAVDGRQGRQAVELILAIYKAAELARPVKLPLAADPVLRARRRRP